MYHGTSPQSAVRTELCHEAMRLAAVLLEHPLGAIPPTYAQRDGPERGLEAIGAIEDLGCGPRRQRKLR